MVIRIAARQSDLARLQAFEVGQAFEKAYAGTAMPRNPLKIEYSFRSSLGDQRAEDPLWQMPEKGVFTQDFVEDLKNGVVDIVVHSWKDLPIGPRDGTEIAATLPRADARDVLLVRKDLWARDWAHDSKRGGASATPQRAFRVLTSSPRRVYNLSQFLTWALPFGLPPQIEFLPVRGNIATRVSKLVTPSRGPADVQVDSLADALVVAKAALDRLLTSSAYGETFGESEKQLRQMLSLTDFIILPLSINPSAAAQGALAIEVRTSRPDILSLCSKIDSADDRRCVEAERAELARHGGGCHQKIGVTYLNRSYGRVEFIKGLTDQGLVLDSVAIQRADDPLKLWPRKILESEICSPEMKAVNRRAVDGFALPPPRGRRHGYFIARANAWIDHGLQANAVVWTAGLATWRQLAQRGVWVHGSSESLGESETARVETLAGLEMTWVKLTHQDVATEEGAVGTYKVDVVPPDVESFRGKKFFFWKSGSQFRAALSVGPEIEKVILDGYHASGPGNTHQALIDVLCRAGLDEAQIESRVALFLNEADFYAQIEKRRLKSQVT